MTTSRIWRDDYDDSDGNRLAAEWIAYWAERDPELHRILIEAYTKLPPFTAFIVWAFKNDLVKSLPEWEHSHPLEAADHSELPTPINENQTGEREK